MDTKIAIVYFSTPLPENRKHHGVSDLWLKTWTYFYKKSKTNMKPVLLMDQSTDIPNVWPYEIVRLKNAEPPQQLDVLNKVGWMKSQSYDVLGRSIVMDLDCLILENIDELNDLNSSIAMPVDPARRTYLNWPEVGEELNAGLILMNDSNVSSRFRTLWNEKNEFIKITYFDELIFSAICREFNGTILPEKYNGSWEIGNDTNMFKTAQKSKILHFHGQRKSHLTTFLKRIIV